ncbi:MAG: hypothetical protein E7554_03605 [Ruminococcaceae bacterium]|nr:hypothetical protein [Oscillospiraceae bacterium]
MKNNRQIGLDGKAFISACLRRGGIFVFALLIYGALNAFSDILKLTGASGAAMSSFTTTLLIYDFVVSLLLIVVVFYAYFLECGSSVPMLKHKPILVFGLFRLGYYILLAYYVCYRALYCLTHPETVKMTLFFFYACYFVLIFCCIIANSYIYNVLTRNVIRRSYRKTFHRLATIGIVVQFILPITYIIARATMVDAGDEFFTSSFCDLLRLCIAPLLLSGIWFLFLHSIRQIDEVFGEVDDALRNKRYQITYAAITDGKKGKKKESAAPVAAAAFLPAPSKTVSTANSPQTPVQQYFAAAAAEAAVAAQSASNVMSPAEMAFASMSPEERAAAEATITDAATEMAAEGVDEGFADVSVPQPVEMPREQNEPIVPDVPLLPEESLVQRGGTTMAYVADVADPGSGVVSGVRVVPVVQDYNPFPDGSAPLNKGKKNNQQRKPGQNKNGGKNQGNRNAHNRQGGNNRQGGKGNGGNNRGPNNGGKQSGGHGQRLNQNRSSQNRPNQNRSGHR